MFGLARAGYKATACFWDSVTHRANSASDNGPDPGGVRERGAAGATNPGGAGVEGTAGTSGVTGTAAVAAVAGPGWFAGAAPVVEGGSARAKRMVGLPQ